MKMELVDAITNQAEQMIDGIHTAIPGRIEEVNFDAGTAVVKPYGFYTLPTGEKMNYPRINDVPMVFPQSETLGACFAFPVVPGDSCLLIVSEDVLDYWLYNRDTGSNVKHDLTNSVCIPGLSRKIGKAFKEAANSRSLIITQGDSIVSLSDGNIVLEGKSVTLKASQSLSIETDGEMNLSAGGNVNISGATINLN